jgi:cell division protein FtsL
MIQPKIAPQTFPATPAEITAHAKPFSKRRRQRRAWLLRYGDTVKVFMGLALVLAPVMVYVMLTSNLTSLNYALANAETERTQLQGEVQRREDQIAHLESRERLARVAAKLGMRDPVRYQVVNLAPPQPERKSTGVAFLGWSLDFARDRLRR